MTSKLLAFLKQQRKLEQAATPGKSWINMLQSNGCEVSLFEREYLIHLAARKPATLLSEEFKRTEKDAEFIINATGNYKRLLDAVEMLSERLQSYCLCTPSVSCNVCFDIEAVEALLCEEGE